MNMRIVAKKSDFKKLEFRDDFFAIAEFFVRYNKAYNALIAFISDKISYKSAMDIVKRTIPEYNAVKFYKACKLFEKGILRQAKELLLECVQSDFNEENIDVQKGNMYGLLAGFVL